MTAAPGVRAPGSLDEALSPRWLSEALGIRFPGVQVTDVERGALDERVSTNAAFRITTEGPLPDGLPAQMWLKGYFGEGAAAGRQVGAIEALFYASLAQTTGVRTLDATYAGLDPATGAGVLITADITASGGRCVDPRQGWTPDLAAQGLEQLAGLHARTWCSPAWADAAWLAPRIELLVDARQGVVAANLAAASAERLPASVRDPEAIIRACRAVGREVAQLPVWCVTHGDTHLGNVFLDGSSHPGFLDWQLVQRGAWYVDVGYHVASTLSVDDRRRSERDLVASYLDQLIAYGLPVPSVDEAMDLVRRGVAYGLYLWSITARVDPAVTTVLLERLGTAAADLDVLDLAGA